MGVLFLWVQHHRCSTTLSPAGRSGQGSLPLASAAAFCDDQCSVLTRSRMESAFSKLGIDLVHNSRLRDPMDYDARDLVNHLGSERAGVMENASAKAALLRGVPNEGLGQAVEKLKRASSHVQALVSAMSALVVMRRGTVSDEGSTH